MLTPIVNTCEVWTHLIVNTCEVWTHLIVNTSEVWTHLIVNTCEVWTHLIVNTSEVWTHLIVNTSEVRTHLILNTSEVWTHLIVNTSEVWTVLIVNTSEVWTHLIVNTSEVWTHLIVNTSEVRTHLTVNTSEVWTQILIANSSWVWTHIIPIGKLLCCNMTEKVTKKFWISIMTEKWRKTKFWIPNAYLLILNALCMDNCSNWISCLMWCVMPCPEGVVRVSCLLEGVMGVGVAVAMCKYLHGHRMHVESLSLFITLKTFLMFTSQPQCLQLSYPLCCWWLIWLIQNDAKKPFKKGWNLSTWVLI